MKLLRTGLLLAGMAVFSAGAMACEGGKHADAAVMKKCSPKNAKAPASAAKKQVVKKAKTLASPSAEKAASRG